MYFVRIPTKSGLMFFQMPDKNFNHITSDKEKAWPFYNFKNALNFAFRNNGFVEYVNQ